MRRAALVTGASSGIGLAISRELGAHGYAVSLVARRTDALEDAAEFVRAAGGEAATQSVDLRDLRTLPDVVAQHEKVFDRLDVLVNCAGVGAPQDVEALMPRRIDLHLDMNIRLPMLLCKEAGPLLLKAGDEHRGALIVNVASIVGRIGVRHFAAYSASKAALVSFTHVLNDEWGDRGVRATAICPGLVETPMTEPLAGLDFPLIQADDVARVVALLLAVSPSCAIPEITMTTPGGDPLAGIRESQSAPRQGSS